MAKNNKKNNQNRNNQPRPQQMQPVAVVNPVAELTSEEKELLRLEGEELKANLIAEGEKEKQRLIEAGKAQAESAFSDVEAKKEKLLAGYKKEARSSILAEVEDERQAIIEEAERIKTDNEAKAKELAEKLRALEDKSNELAAKIKEYMKNCADFEISKTDYRSTIAEEQKQYLDTLKLELDKLTATNGDLLAQIKEKQKEIDSLRSDINDLENDVDENNIRRQKVLSLELRLKEQELLYQTLNAEYTGCLERLADKEALIKKFGADPQRAIEENKALQSQLKVALDRLSSYPPEDEIGGLRVAVADLEKLRIQHQEVSAKLRETEEELRKAVIYKDDLDNQRRFIKILELQKSELQKELDRVVGLYENQSTHVFNSLSKLDESFQPSKYASSVPHTLKYICENFRNYLASRDDKEKLYYNIKHIRTFIAGFASARLMILKGMSGTGKSSLPTAFMDYVKCVTESVSVQSSWKDRNDLLGFYNDFKKQYKETDFLKMQYQATLDSDNIYCIVLDEMNLSRIEYYFADYLSVLEKEESKWRVNLISEDVQGEMPKFVVDGNLQIRNNCWFIGTANDDDSVQTITDKVYDRAIVIDFKEREDPFKPAGYFSTIELSNSAFQKLLKSAIVLSEADKVKIAQLVDDLDFNMKVYFSISFGNRISKQIGLFVAAYMACGGDMIEAIDIMFATKVLRKLQGRYDESTKKNLLELLAYIVKKYPDNKQFEMTKETIKDLEARI